ncbi:hybrid-cluster NAD(P)-dependent oxidoreductase [Vibrio sp. Of14-4]|uniref:hybrid-cluster NAD(P)-dependent oxidoreductase n=1 Tax=Vibrio sp. Of14-4 TaxID=2724878 RepID=UPI001EF2E44C|nr:hybrid-cluster NAD(P)-dependent oxidoreductase [Vibrio sp. Of14-4]MCG7490406.1 hybrid-cluster NAD(P)-dependent oxidoreductase [Vibrio sp. Of14-4]
MSAPSLCQINVYPVKSLGGITQSNCWVEKQGLMFDRRFMLALADGSMITARKYPQMVTIQSSLTADGLIFVAEGKSPLKLRYADFKMQETPAQVWKDNFAAYTTTDEADDWFSDVLNLRVELLFSGEQSNRIREKVGHNVSFADGYPMLVIGQGSLDELNRRSPQQHSMDQFRSNLIVSTTEPFEEDSWKRIRIGEVEFESVKPCERCIMTTVDVSTGKLRETKEPLKTLSQFRANERGGVFFGQNLVAKNEGMIRQGDRVEVLEYKEKEFYPDNLPTQLKMTCVEKEPLARDFITFWLEPQSGIVPKYLPGQHLPISIQIGDEKVARRYTLSSSPSRPGRLAISVKRIDEGRVSNWLHEHLNVGDALVCEYPQGSFYLDEQCNKPILLLSAGSGVTPMLSMLRYLSDNDQADDVFFYHQCRSVEDIPYKEELDELKQKHPGLRLLISLSQPPVDWFGLKGRLTLSHLKQIKDVEKKQVFVCGPDEFMQKAKSLLLKKGLPEDCYHQEAFGVSNISAKPLKSLQLSVNGHVFTGDNQKPLLDQAEEAGVSIANSCRAGLCGACKVTIQSGKVHQPDVPGLQDSERNMGIALACCCVPETDIDVSS